MLEIGDADDFDQLRLGSGVWNLAITATPADHPDEITIWLNPNVYSTRRGNPRS